MAENTSTFTLKVETKGMPEAKKDSQAIKDNLEGAQKAASGVGTTAAKLAGTTSSRKVASSAAAMPTGAAGVSAGISGSEVEEYNRAAGTSGRAGGSARDFADQARGLGGLVRLYATFAANIFAATAAFGALSRAMDTTNMIQGLDQLGAASGRNLGTLSKDLALASDGAISLRDSMEATAKASAAGLTNKQILQVGEAAKKASLALGVSMPDALSRLSRGIAKIEPELLDELGLFVKIDDATQTYARSIGKTASSLTDFERRQAFANAVLEQANQKFSNITVDVNPYNKLLASLQNILQSGLELINKVLGPIVKLLSESPTALTAVLVGIGVTLLKSVLPVVGQWRQGLRAAADDAADTAERIKKSFGDEFQSRLETRFRIPNLQKSLKDTEDQISKISQQQSALAAPPTARLARAAVAQSDVADEKSIATVERMISNRQKYIDTGVKGSKQLSQTAVEGYREEVAWLDKKLQKLQQEAQLNALNAQKAREAQALDEAFRKAQIVADKPPGRFDPETIATKQYEDAIKRRDRLAAVSSAAENARILGVRQAWALLNQEIAEKGITGIDKFTTRASGGIAAVGARIMGVVGSLGQVGMVVAALAGVWELVSSFASANKKEAEEAATGFDRLNESAKFIDKVLSDLEKKDPLSKISVDAVNARATALNELTTNLSDQINKITRQVETANWFDILVDTAKANVGLGLLKQSAKETALSVTQSFKVMSEGPRKSEAIEKFKEAFNVDPTDQEAVRKLLVESPEKFLNLAPQVAALMKQIGIETANVASRGKELIAAFDTAEKTLKDFVTSSLPTDPVAKFGAELIGVATKLDEALKDPETTLAAIVDISKSASKQAILGDSGERIASQGEKYKTAAANLAVYNQALEQQTARQKELVKSSTDTSRSGRRAQREDKELEVTNKAIDTLKTARDSAKDVITTATQELNKAQKEAFETGTKFIQAGINAAFAKAAITVSNAFAQRLGDTEAGISRRAELEKQSNNLQIAQLQAQKNMLGLQSSVQDAITANTLATELNTLEIKEGKGKPLSQEDQKRREEIKKQQATAASGGAADSPQKKLLDLARGNIDAQIAQIQASNKAVDVRAEDERGARRIKVANDILSVETDRLNTRKQFFDIETKSLPYLDTEQVARKKQLDDQLLLNKQTQEYSAIQKEIDRNQRTLADKDASKKNKDAAAAALRDLGQEAIRSTDRQAEERKRSEQSYYQFVIENEQKRVEFIAAQEAKLSQIAQDTINIRQDTANKLSEIELSTAEQTGVYTEKYIADLKYQAEVSKISEESKRKEAALTTQYKLRQDELYREIAAQLAITGGEGNTRSAAAALELTALQDKYRAEVGGIKSVTEAQLNQAGAIRAAKTEQDSFNKSLNVLKDFEAVFASMGSAVSGLVTALYDAGQAQKKYNDSRADLQKKISTEKDDKKQVELKKQLGALDDERAKDEVSNTAKVAGSVKNLFKEKTAAYKAFATLEKALHIARLAMDAQQLASGMATTAATVGQSLTRAFAYGKEAIASAFAAPFPINFATGAAMTAIIASLLGKAFGGKATQPEGFTAEEQNNVQGTGRTYRDGKLVDREGGLLGEPTAKASSVSKSLELVGKNTFENLEYSNKMVDALKSIEKNTRGLTAAMLRSIGPQAQGSLAGSIQTGEVRGNYLGGNTLVNAGLGAAGGFAAGVGMLSTGLGTAAMAGASALLGITATSMLNFVLPGIGLLLAKPLGKLMGSIFGGKTTKTIEAFGITVNGVLDDVVAGTKGVIEEWANVKTVRKGGWFRSDKTTFAMETQEATDPIKALIGNLFMGVRDSLTAAGEVLGKDVSSTIGSFLIKDFKINSKDLKPEELAAAIQGEVSIAFNQMAMAAFPEFEQFAQPFEEAGETIIRLARQVQVFDLAMTSISKSTELMSNMMKVEVSNSLVELAGGLEQFVERTNFYAENFLTEAERLEPVQKAVTTELGKLGLGFVDTREEFKAVVNAIDLTVPAGRDLYNSLMNLAPGFAQVYKESQKSLSSEEMRSKVLSQQQQVLKLLGDTQGLLNLQREEELAELSKYPKAQADILKANQKYIYALEDEQTVKDKLIKQQDKLKNTVKSLQSALDNLNSYRTTLLTGENSILTPLQKYQESQSEFLKLQALATGPATTEAEKTAQQEAISKLPGVADKFLASSRTMFASGSQYVDDFNRVMSAVGDSSSILSAQKTDAELQLEQLQSAAGFLNTINESSTATAASTSALLAEYKLATANTAAAQANYTPPVNAAPAQVTDTAVVNQLVAANVTLAQLQKDIVKLREEQNKQTGAVINSNAQVSQNSANTVAAAVEHGLSYSEWRDRMVVDLP